jgi:hypothetical protein
MTPSQKAVPTLDLEETRCRLCGEPRPGNIDHIWACCGDGPGYAYTIKPEKLACAERQLAQATAKLSRLESALEFLDTRHAARFRLRSGHEYPLNASEVIGAAEGFGWVP